MQRTRSKDSASDFNEGQLGGDSNGVCFGDLLIRALISLRTRRRREGRMAEGIVWTGRCTNARFSIYTRRYS